jgi:EFR3, armadillo repeat
VVANTHTLTHQSALSRFHTRKKKQKKTKKTKDNMCFKWCCAKVRPKYKRVILDVYPDDIGEGDSGNGEDFDVLCGSHDAKNDSGVAHLRKPAAENLSALTYYANTIPKHLSTMGAYLLKLIRRDITAGFHLRAEIGMLAFEALIEACHSDLARLDLYDASVREAIVLLMESDCVDLKVRGLSTFVKLMQYQDVDADFIKFEPFFELLCTMCEFDGVNNAQQERVRMAALKAMNQMVLCNDVHLVVKRFDGIVPAVLTNIPAEADIAKLRDEIKLAEEDDDTIEQTSVHAALTVLHSIAGTPTTNTATILQPLLQYLDKMDWQPIEYGVNCILMLTQESQQARFGDMVCYGVLRHIESTVTVNSSSTANSGQDEKHAHAVAHLQRRAHIVQVVTGLLSAMRVQIGPWEGALFLLMQQLQMIGGASHGAESWQLLSHAVAQCAGAYAAKVEAEEDAVEMLNLVLHECSRDPGVEIESRAAMLQAAVCIAKALRPLPQHYTFPDILLLRVLYLLRSEKQSDLKLTLYRLLHNVLVPPVDADAQSSSDDAKDSSPRTPSSLVDNHSTAGDRKRRSSRPSKPLALLQQVSRGAENTGSGGRVVPLTEHQYMLLSTAMYHELEHAQCSPMSISNATLLLIIMALRNQHSEVMSVTPMLIASCLGGTVASTAAENDDETAPNATPRSPRAMQHSRILMTACASYFLHVARSFALHGSPDCRRTAAQFEELLSQQPHFSIEDLEQLPRFACDPSLDHVLLEKIGAEGGSISPRSAGSTLTRSIIQHVAQLTHDEHHDVAELQSLLMQPFSPIDIEQELVAASHTHYSPHSSRRPSISFGFDGDEKSSGQDSGYNLHSHVTINEFETDSEDSSRPGATRHRSHSDSLSFGVAIPESKGSGAGGAAAAHPTNGSHNNVNFNSLVNQLSTSAQQRDNQVNEFFTRLRDIEHATPKAHVEMTDFPDAEAAAGTQNDSEKVTSNDHAIDIEPSHERRNSLGLEFERSISSHSNHDSNLDSDDDEDDDTMYGAAHSYLDAQFPQLQSFDTQHYGAAGTMLDHSQF